MFGNTLQRMILGELIKVFVLALVALTGLFLMAGLIAEASQRGLAPAQMLAIMPLLIPNTLPYTIPTTTLFATCVVYGRLASDNEITAIKAAGVHLRVVLAPCLFLGIATSAVTMSLYYYLIPYTHQVMRKQFLNDGEELIYGLLKRNHSIRFSNLPYVMYVREVQGKRLVDMILKKRVKKGDYWIGYDLIIWAKEASLRVETRPEADKSVLVLDMERCTILGDRTVSGYYKEQRFPLELPPELTGGDLKTRPTDLTWEELLARRVEVTNEQADLAVRVAVTQARIAAPDRPVGQVLDELRERFASAGRPLPPLDVELQTATKSLMPHLVHLQNKHAQTGRMILAIDTEVASRPTLSLGCLCFVLVGCPVGIWFSRSDYLSSFVTCFLPTVFLYYPLVLCGTGLAKDGKLPAWLATGAADIMFLIVAGFLIQRLLRR